jgi:hypothetical protein
LELRTKTEVTLLITPIVSYKLPFALADGIVIDMMTAVPPDLRQWLCLAGEESPQNLAKGCALSHCADKAEPQ